MAKAKQKNIVEEALVEENLRLRQQVDKLQLMRKINIDQFFGDEVHIGILSDTHMGNLYARGDYLQAAYEVFQRLEIENVYHCGDLLDGENMYRGQVYDLQIHGADAQIEYCVNEYPEIPGITTHFITGNHDHSFWKRAGVNVGRRIDALRPDMNFLGEDEATVQVKMNGASVKMRLAHPGKGTSYALSYQPQKYVEALSGGQKPHMVFIGHYHKAEWMPMYMNVHTLQTGCLQSQTPFMRSRSLAAHTGFWTLRFSINPGGLVSRFEPRYFAFYEEES